MYELCQSLGLPIERAGWRLGFLFGGILGALFAASPPAQAGTLTIVPTFDSTITGASNAAQIEAAINSAITTIDGLYSTFNTVTDNVYFKLGPGDFLGSNTSLSRDGGRGCSGAIWMGNVLPHRGMFPRRQALPHQVCSRCLI